jgi:hypothetical protein
MLDGVTKFEADSGAMLGFHERDRAETGKRSWVILSHIMGFGGGDMLEICWRFWGKGEDSLGYNDTALQKRANMIHLCILFAASTIRHEV